MNARSILSRLRLEKKSDSIGSGAPQSCPEILDGECLFGAVVDTRQGDLCSRVVTVLCAEEGDESLRISLFEDCGGVTGSGNGATLWDCSIILTKYLLLELEVKRKRVIELGSGLGLPSIALAIRGNEVVATERSITTELLKLNIDANIDQLKGGGSICLMSLDWSTCGDGVIANGTGGSFDLIIGSDLVFPSNKAEWRSLAHTYRMLLDQSRDRNPKAYLAYEAREEAAIDLFKDVLLRQGMQCVLMTPSKFVVPRDLFIFELSIIIE